MPKAELHLHLEGSIQAETLLAIDPALSAAEIQANLKCRTFEEFLRGYIWITGKLQTPAHYALATRHLLERLAAENVTYAEITLSAGVVLWKQQDLAAVYEAVWKESQRSRVRTYWILDAVRHFGAEHGMDVARFAVTRREHGVIAYGIGGDEARGPAEWFRDVFAFARDGGLHLVCHAGETCGPESICVPCAGPTPFRPAIWDSSGDGGQKRRGPCGKQPNRGDPGGHTRQCISGTNNEHDMVSHISFPDWQSLAGVERRCAHRFVHVRPQRRTDARFRLDT